MNEVLYKTKNAAEKALGEIVDKGLNNPTDLCCALDGVKILAQVATIEAMERAQWTEEESRRMRSMATNGNSYGMSYADPYWESESMRRARNSLGQFTSRANNQQSNSSYGGYDGGYSGHSVNDMMIQSLERTITPDMSEVEKQRIYEQIRMIRERKD